MQTSLYLIDSGVELGDGETVGPERYRVARRDAGIVDGSPVYELRSGF